MTQVWTPDHVLLDIPVSFVVILDEDRIIEFEDSGSEEGVKSILTDIIEERLREWAISNVEGPKTWGDALRAQAEAMRVILGRIFGDQWPSEKSDQEELVKRFRAGKAEFKILDLGIKLIRLTIGEIKPVNRSLLDASTKSAIEIEEKRGERVETEFVMEFAAQISKARGISFKEAVEIIQIERGKIKREIKERRLGTTSELGELAMKVAEIIADAIKNRKPSVPPPGKKES